MEVVTEFASYLQDLLPSVPSPAYAPGLKTNAQLLDMLKLILYLEKFPNLVSNEWIIVEMEGVNLRGQH